jgi:hypothetical protein
MAAPRPRSGVLPVIEAKPLSGAERTALDWRGQGSGTLDPTRTAHDPELIHALQRNFMGAGVQDLSEQIAPFNPTTKMGLLNLGATFFPGAGRGGRFGGKLTTGQEYLLDSLANVRTSKGRAHPDWMIEYLDDMGLESKPRTFYEHRQTLGQFPEKGTPAYELAEKLGVPRADPLHSLRNYVEPPLGREHEPLVGQSDPKLGLSPSDKPPWPLRASERRQIAKEWAHYPDYVKEILQEVHVDDRADVARVIATILRREMQGRGGNVDLGEYGGN